MSTIFRTFMAREIKFRQDPTVKVRINGLAFLCFSRLHKRAEVGFLKVKNHPLLLTIYDKNCVPVPNMIFELDSGTIIDINQKNPGLGALYTPDLGDTPDDSDDWDFRHLLDLDGLHAKLTKSKKVKVKPANYLAQLSLSQGFFFTAKRSLNKATVISDEGAKDDPRRVGKVIGADIAGQEIEINISSEEEPIRLKKDGNSPYKVIIRYKCEGKSSKETDFQEFHKILKLPKEKRLDLFYDIAEPAELIKCEKQLKEALDNKMFRVAPEKEEIVSRLLENFTKAEEACQASTKPECPTNLLGIVEPC